MAYRSTALRVLISCPGDVSPDDLSVVHKAITRWNVLLGEQFEHVVVPVSWSEHAASEFGEPPQDILNRQLVDVVDLGIAIFWNRLGTKTNHAESGTAEEIQRLHDAGKPVSVLRCNRHVSPRGDHEERARLDRYLTELFGRALLVNYETDAQLAAQIDTILTRMATQHDWISESNGNASGGRRRGAYILPKVDTDRVGADSRGILQKLIFKNESQAVAGREIQWKLGKTEGAFGDLPTVLVENNTSTVGLIPVLAGGAEFEYTLIAGPRTTPFVVCRVSWQENGGVERNNETTLSMVRR
jgi:hypothetical protein